MFRFIAVVLLILGLGCNTCQTHQEDVPVLSVEQKEANKKKQEETNREAEKKFGEYLRQRFPGKVYIIPGME